MKTTLCIIAATLALGACDMGKAPPAAPANYNNMSPKERRAKLLSDARERCMELGYEEGTKDYRDCLNAQFNKMSEKYYGL